MNNKGQSMQLMIIVFVALLVGVIVFQVAAQQIGTATNTVTATNLQVTLAGAGNGTYINDYRALESVTVVNRTGAVTLHAGNYTITNGVINPTTGSLAVQINTTATSEYADGLVNVSGTAQPLTYITSSGGRSIANLVVIFFALAIVMVALYPVYESKLKELLG